MWPTSPVVTSDFRQTRKRQPVRISNVIDADACYRAVQSKDQRFDGLFFTGVVSTGIYCRPSCPATTPQRHHVSFHPSAAAAQLAGFRACKRCRPDATPGSPEWSGRADLVGRAMRLIGDGVVDRHGVSALAARLGYSERQVHRQLVAEVGAGPMALARAQRAQAARVLLETTNLPVTEVAFAAGFASVRQFNDTIRQVFAAAPTALRQGRRAPRPAGGPLCVRLPYREPYDAPAMVDFLAARAVPGVEEVTDGAYRRTLRLPRGSGTVELVPADGYFRCTLWLTDMGDVVAAVSRCRRLLDLDADPISVSGDLQRHCLLRPLVEARPGLRVPGTVCGDEVALRAVLGQQISVAAARTLAGRLVRRFGTPLSAPHGGLTHLFPEAAALAQADPESLPLTSARRATLANVARGLAGGVIELHPGADRVAVTAQLQSLAGVGPWTAQYVAMRALGDPDVFLATDLGVRRALEKLGQPSESRAVTEMASPWGPWRSYAMHHLWSTLGPLTERSLRAG